MKPDNTGPFTSTTPFTREFSIGARFKLDLFEEATQSICATIEKRMSASLIAPAGSGKTAVLRAVSDQLAAARYKVTYIKVTDISQRDMCRQVSLAIGAKPASLFFSLVESVQNCLSDDYHVRGLRPVLLIDEAQDMRPETVSILKLLTNFEMDSRLVVSFVLAGQPALRQLLEKERLQDIAQRIYHHTELRLLSQGESHDYLRHRWSMASSGPFPFDERSLQAIFEMGRGNMRAMESLALKALEMAQSKKIACVDESLIVQARKTLWL